LDFQRLFNIVDFWRPYSKINMICYNIIYTQVTLIKARKNLFFLFSLNHSIACWVTSYADIKSPVEEKYVSNLFSNFGKRRRYHQEIYHYFIGCQNFENYCIVSFYQIKRFCRNKRPLILII
jgi:hypothetical protein